MDNRMTYKVVDNDSGSVLVSTQTPADTLHYTRDLINVDGYETQQITYIIERDNQTRLSYTGDELEDLLDDYFDTTEDEWEGDGGYSES